MESSTFNLISKKTIIKEPSHPSMRGPHFQTNPTQLSSCVFCWTSTTVVLPSPPPGFTTQGRRKGGWQMMCLCLSDRRLLGRWANLFGSFFFLPWNETRTESKQQPPHANLSVSVVRGAARNARMIFDRRVICHPMLPRGGISWSRLDLI